MTKGLDMSIRRITFLAPLLLLPACTITTHIDPLPHDAIKAVCIKENTAVWSKDFLPALRHQFEVHGITTRMYTDNAPADCQYHVEYEANWSWDLAVYLA